MSARRRHTVNLGCLLLALWLSMPRPAHAVDWDGPDDAEKNVLSAVRQGKLIRARELAEKLLKRRPDSFVGRYGLTLVFHDEEANLPRALHQVRRAEKDLLRHFGDPPQNRNARVWHARLLQEEATLLGEMDRRKEQLSVMDRHDGLYQPKMDRWRIWPLMKLHRFAEAEALAQKVALSSDPNERISGYNGLIAIESERLRPARCFSVGLKAVVATGSRSCILNQNTAEAAFAVFKFADAESLALKSIQAPIQDCPASAYPHLANLYLLRADFARAMEAIKSARTSHVEKRYRQQFEMSHTAWLARLLHTLGKFDQAERLAERATHAPDRVGMTSFSDEVMKVVYTLDHHATLRAEMEAAREKLSVRPLWDQPKLVGELVELSRKAWLTRRRVARLLASSGDLVYLVRPYLKPLPPWHAGELVYALGSGVVVEAVRRARISEKEDPVAGVARYFEALEAETAFADGQLSRAYAKARSALGGLPKDEVLLRGRLLAMTAHAALKLGKGAEAEDRFDKVLSRFPTALRILGIPLPARIQAGSSALAQKLGKRLLGSRRLTDGAGFTVRVTGDRADLRVCLESRAGRRYHCATARDAVAPPASRSTGTSKKKTPSTAPKRPATSVKAAIDKLSDDELLERLADAFHQKVFAPRIDLTQWDINSLDGSAVRGDADELLDKVLGP